MQKRKLVAINRTNSKWNTTTHRTYIIYTIR